MDVAFENRVTHNSFAEPKPFHIILGILLILVGGFNAYLFAGDFGEARQALSWSPHEAQILDAEIMTIESSDFGDPDTYRVKVYYEYDWQGETYNGDKLNFFESSSSNYRHHRAKQKELLTARKSKTAYPIYVNPNNPAESVIENKMKWGEVLLRSGFSLAFFLISIPLIVRPIRNL